MNESEQKRAGVIALSLCLGGLVLAILLGILTSALEHYDHTPAYVVFLGFQIAGFILGIVSRHEVLGKTAYVTAAVFVMGSILFL